MGRHVAALMGQNRVSSLTTGRAAILENGPSSSQQYTYCQPEEWVSQDKQWRTNGSRVAGGAAPMAGPGPLSVWMVQMSVPAAAAGWNSVIENQSGSVHRGDSRQIQCFRAAPAYPPPSTHHHITTRSCKRRTYTKLDCILRLSALPDSVCP